MTTANCATASPAPRTRRAPPLATTASSWKNTSSSRATSRSRSWATRIAAGEKLPFRQKDVRQSGWAIEARVYAEDPQRNFLPSIGRLVRYRPPDGDGLRVDTGVFEGAEITLHYDPLIAKLIACGDDRDQAIERLRGALDGFY